MYDRFIAPAAEAVLVFAAVTFTGVVLPVLALSLLEIIAHAS
jgi:hypothetical protein